MTAVAIVGLGRMGAPMARNAKAGGLDLALFDADAALTRRLADELGARALAGPADFAEAGIDVVVTMLPTSAIVASVLFGDSGDAGKTGIVGALKAGAIVVDMSSSDPSDSIATATRAGEHDVQFVDAPVSGGVAGAERGTLTIMLGGGDEQAATVTPVLETMSARIVRTGPVGSGHAMKALNNVVAGATTIACFEALQAGGRFGLEPATMVDIWNTSTAQSFVTAHVIGPEVVEGRFASGYSLPLYAKDVGVAESIFAETGVDAPVCATTASRFRAAHDALGDVDHSRIAEVYDMGADAREVVRNPDS
ncbi:MAG: NAD(P)-dependent oxidoreductase [Pseudoclavibacter sp.]